MAGDYLNELAAIQRWIKTTAGLNSLRLSEAPPAVARPVILWEAPSRSRDRNLGRYTYVVKVVQYGKLFVNSVDQLATLQEILLGNLEERVGVLPLYDVNGAERGKIKRVELFFTESENLDVPIRIQYEATYGRIRPADLPPATRVMTTVKSQGGKVFVGDIIPPA